MKYIKEYKQYLNESNGREFEFSIFNIFRPFGRLISNINTNSKLVTLINDYDEYLYNVYIEYLERKKHLPKEELENSEIKVIGQDKKIHIDGIENDDDLENDTQNNAQGTNGEAGNKIEDNTPEIYSSKKVMNTDSPFIDDVEQGHFAEMVDELVADENMFQLRQLRSEYSDALKKDSQRLVIVKKDMNNINALKKSATEEKLSLDTHSPKYAIEHNKLEDKINVYNTELGKISDKTTRLLNNIGQHKWYLEEINKAIRFLERKKREEKEKADKLLSEQPVETVTESNDWRGGAVYDTTWTDIDMQKIGYLVNPFQVEEFHLKAENVINNSKNPDKYKNKWNLYLNSLYKKWYYTFDVRNLRNLSPNLNTTKKIDKKEDIVKKDLAYSSLILEELFPNIKTYSYRFKMLSDDKNKYFILLSKNDMLLMKKILFKDGTYSFQFLSVLRPNKENNNIVATKMLNTIDEKMKILVNDKEIALYKERKDYPIFFIKDGDMYTTTNFEDFEGISLKNCNIYSLKDESFKKLIKNSNVTYEDKLPSASTFEKIKNTNLK